VVIEVKEARRRMNLVGMNPTAVMTFGVVWKAESPAEETQETTLISVERLLTAVTKMLKVVMASGAANTLTVLRRVGARKRAIEPVLLPRIDMTIGIAALVFLKSIVRALKRPKVVMASGAASILIGPKMVGAKRRAAWVVLDMRIGIVARAFRLVDRGRSLSGPRSR
jgi:hypothetical protein